MGYYKVLGNPRVWGPSAYKGLYRDEPPHPSDEGLEITQLWDRYTEYLEKAMGVTSELSLGELKCLAKWFGEHTGVCYEVVYFDEGGTCPNEAIYYGIDVAGFGGYSILGEGLFHPEYGKSDHDCLLGVVSHHFGQKLNENCLFRCLDDATNFRAVLRELNSGFPGSVEDEDWRVVHIYGVT